MIDYSQFEDEYRANSVLEQYNGRIKDSLPRTPNWAVFIDFIVTEENKYVTESFLNEQKGIIKTKSASFAKKFIPKCLRQSPEKETHTIKTNKRNPPHKRKSTSSASSLIETKKSKKTNASNDLVLFDNDKKIAWTKWEKNSCRYDALITVFTLGLYKKYDLFHERNVDKSHDLFKHYQKLVETADKFLNQDFDSKFELWEFLNDMEFDDEEVGEMGCISPLINLFKPIRNLEIEFNYDVCFLIKMINGNYLLLSMIIILRKIFLQFKPTMTGS
jgi:hypothetical protein